MYIYCKPGEDFIYTSTEEKTDKGLLMPGLPLLPNLICEDVDGIHGRWIAGKTISQIKAERAEAVSAIKVTVDGMEFDGDEISQGRMARAVAASSSNSETTTWVLANNTAVTVTIGQLKQALRLAGEAQTAMWVI